MPFCPVLTAHTAIVGSGAAGYNAAISLKKSGIDDLLVVSENRFGGTSRNTGSDKQTYYKLTLSGGVADSVEEMAKTLFEGKCADGDIALAEAALSVQGFMHLAGLGLPFPRNRYGEFVGYKTDHDPRERATSIGPYTSREMTNALEKEAQSLGIPFRDNALAIEILSDRKRVYGLLCLDTMTNLLFAVECENIVYATGGPAGIYLSSAYPESQHGATGIALKAGAWGRNLTEWQYGLASIKPRWNVSGTYMQALPRVYSTGRDLSGEREFLLDFFRDREAALGLLFLKGYQWPFDVRRAQNGSSIIDVLVYGELCKGRRVFLDYTKDPGKGKIDFASLPEEARRYLERAGALVDMPIERLRIMNAPAISFYRDMGVDLEKESLEISLCAQHNNGGLAINLWWETSLKHLFAVGEVAASHGVYRPGGSALNSGQVGSLRAAQFIKEHYSGKTAERQTFNALLEKAIGEAQTTIEKTRCGKETAKAARKRLAGLMSQCAGAIRDKEKIEDLLAEIDRTIENFDEEIKCCGSTEVKDVFRLKDSLVTQKCCLDSMLNYLGRGGKSRGSAIYKFVGPKSATCNSCGGLPFREDDGKLDGLVQEVEYLGGKCRFHWREVRPIPARDDFFENVWRGYRENGNIE